MIDLLIILLVPAIKCVEGGSRSPLHILAALIAFILDLIIARTTWRLIAGPLHPGERTISDSLERLCNESENPNQQLFIQLALKINRATGFPHIKAAATCLK